MNVSLHSVKHYFTIFNDNTYQVVWKTFLQNIETTFTKSVTGSNNTPIKIFSSITGIYKGNGSHNVTFDVYFLKFYSVLTSK